MKTTLDLPEDLVREMKLRAVHEGRKLREVATEIFRRGLAQPSQQTAAATQPGVIQNRVKLPLIQMIGIRFCPVSAARARGIVAGRAKRTTG